MNIRAVTSSSVVWDTLRGRDACIRTYIHTYVCTVYVCTYVQENLSITTLKGPSDGGFVDRWSLYRSAVVSLRWPMELPAVVTIDRWSLNTRGF